MVGPHDHRPQDSRGEVGASAAAAGLVAPHWRKRRLVHDKLGDIRAHPGGPSALCPCRSDCSDSPKEAGGIATSEHEINPDYHVLILAAVSNG